jgi:hypothetical protein
MKISSKLICRSFRQLTRRLTESRPIFFPTSVEVFSSVEPFLNDGSSVDAFDVDRTLQRRVHLDLVELARVQLVDLAAILSTTGSINLWEKERSYKM